MESFLVADGVKGGGGHASSRLESWTVTARARKNSRRMWSVISRGPSRRTRGPPQSWLCELIKVSARDVLDDQGLPAKVDSTLADFLALDVSPGPGFTHIEMIAQFG